MIVTGIFTLLEGSRGISSGQSSSESMFLQLSGVLLLETHSIFSREMGAFFKKYFLCNVIGPAEQTRNLIGPGTLC